MRVRSAELLVFGVVAALLGSLMCGSAQAGLQSVWAVDDGEKIFRDNITSPLKNGNSVWNGSSVSLFAARNEIVAFQLILEADGSGANTVNVTVSDITNGAYTISGSHPLPAPNDYVGVGVELFTEHYLDVSQLSGDPNTGYFNWTAAAAPVNSGMTTGWIPDGLVPFSAAQGKGGAPFNISANSNQGVWVDIYVDKDLPAGTYSGTITVTVGGNTVATIPVNLQVLDFTLSDDNHYQCMIYYSEYCLAPRHNVSGSQLWNMLGHYNRMAHRHRLDLIGSGTWDEVNNLGGTISGDAYTSAQGYEGPGEGVGNSVFSICTYGVYWADNETAYRTESDAWVNWFDANAPNVDYFLYLIDEPGSDQYDWINTRASWIHNNPGPGNRLPVFVTKRVTDALIGSVDIWGSPTGAWDSQTASQAESRGEQVWTYAAWRPKTPADVTDEWAIAYRLKPWIAHQWSIPRWFTWESTHYIGNWNELEPDQPKNVWVDPLTFHTSSLDETGNGDGLLFYPGQDYVFPAQNREYPGPIASYRMKMYRRGVQDVEYMWLAEQAGKGQDVQNILADLLPHTMDNAFTVPDWSNSNAVYDQARGELALLLGPAHPPIAKFSGSPTRGPAPLTVNFTDLSILGPTSWSWTFGDGGTSTAQHPSHQYTGSGSFTVSLTATNAQGEDTETKVDYITLTQEAVVYPDEWTTQTGWADTIVVSGGLSDLHTDNNVYMVMRPDNAAQQYSVLYTCHSGYTPDQVAKITIEYEAKCSRSDTPGSGLVFGRHADASWEYLGDWRPGTSDTWYLWETANVSTYLGSDGILGFELCGCPSGSNSYNISSDVMRFRLELVGPGPQPPVADFSGSPTSGTAPLTVNFTDLSSNSPTSWSWTFGDTGTSTAQNPSHQYTSAGDYTVSLTATNSAGSDTETKTNYISVSSAPQPPVADFSGSPTSGTAPLTVNFTDLSSNGPTSWSWDFGDTGTSTAQHPSHQYTGAGDYTVSLTATNSAGSDTETKPNYISVSSVPSPPVADFSGSPTSGTAPLTVNFTDLSANGPTSWSWDFGDTATSSAQNPSHEYTSVGDYTVSLTVTNSAGEDTETKPNYISVIPAGLTTIFSDDFEAEFSGWTTSDQVDWYTGTPRNGTHSVRLRRYGSMEQTISTVGYSNTTVSFYMGANSLDNSSENVEAHWYDGTSWTLLKRINDGDPEEDNQLHYFEYSLPAGAEDNANFALRFRINGSGSWDYGYVDDVLMEGYAGAPQPPVADFSGSPTSGTAPLTVNFTDLSTNSPTSWSWTFGDAGTSTTQNPSHEYTTADTYTVSLTATNAQGSDTETKTDYITVTSGPSLVDVYPDTWATSSWAEVTLLSGGLADLQLDDGSYMVMQCNSSTQRYWVEYTADSTYEPSQVTKIIYEYQAKRSRDDTPAPGSSLVWVRKADGTWYNIGSWLPDTTDTTYTWETTDVTTYMDSSGVVGFRQCGCPANSNIYTISSDLLRFRLELAGPPAPPVADFSGSPTTGAAPLTVDFTDLSTNSPTSWSWDFGDTGTATAQNPSHDYTSADNYTVSLTATNAGGSDTETKPDYITVTVPPPVADFSGNPTSGTAPLTVNFTDLSTNSPTSWSWDFGDTGSSTAQNPSHQYTSGGSYTVSLTAANAGGEDTETKPGYINVSELPPPPVADFSGSPTSGPTPLTVNFTDLSANSPTSWSWDFGDTATSSAQNPSHDYTSAGSFTVSLTATNAGGQDTETKPDYITVALAAPVADFSGSPTSGTAPLTVNFTDLSTNTPTSWSWDFGDTGTATAQNPTHDYTSDGSYTVSLTATNASGSDTETKPDYIAVSTGPTTIFSDDFEDAFEGWTTTGTPDWYTGTPRNGTHSIRLRGSGSSGYDEAIERTISTAGYQDITVTFYLGAYSLDNSSEYVEAVWYNGSDWAQMHRINNGDPEENNQLHAMQFNCPAGANNNPNFAIKFGIVGSGTGDYGYVDDVVVEGYAGAPQPPVADFSGSPTSGTAPLTVNFTDLSTNTPTSWSWDFGDTGTSTAQNPSHEYTSTGDYTVSLTATNSVGSDTETKTNYISVSSQQDIYVYPYNWTSWAGVTLLSGALSDLQTDNDVYMVYRCNTSNRQFEVEYQWDTNYAPADLSKITVELQWKGSQSETPAYGLLIWNYATSGWDDLRAREPGWPTTDTWFTWETTSVSTYLNAAGEMRITYCGCPQNSNNYDTSIDVTRMKFTLN